MQLMLQLMPLNGVDELMLVYSSSPFGSKESTIPDVNSTVYIIPNTNVPGTYEVTLVSVDQEDDLECFNTSNQLSELIHVIYV